MGIEHPDQAALRVGDPRVRPGAVLIRNDGDPARQIREPGPAPVLGHLQHNPAVFVVGVLRLENTRGRESQPRSGPAHSTGTCAPPVRSPHWSACRRSRTRTPPGARPRPAPRQRARPRTRRRGTAPAHAPAGHQSATVAVGWSFPGGWTPSGQALTRHRATRRQGCKPTMSPGCPGPPGARPYRQAGSSTP